MRVMVALLLIFCSTQSCFGWSEGGHHLIASLAFDLIKPENQNEIIEILKSHPRYAEDFNVPEKITDQEEINSWLIGQAGYWPDIARKTSFDRPKWHYQLGASVKIGNPGNVPANPGPVPEDATMDTKDLHIGQAIDLCRKILKDKARPNSERALALCWICHLVADAHQPCHAGSLYSEVAFPDGDRGANSVPTKQQKNLHALWDSLLGPKFNAGDVQRRKRAITWDKELVSSSISARSVQNGLEAHFWLSESAYFAEKFVYKSEILQHIESVERGELPKLEQINLTKLYLSGAGKIAQNRAAFAAYRLAAVLNQDL